LPLREIDEKEKNALEVLPDEKYLIFRREKQILGVAARNEEKRD
jgi:hypothetical protein